MFPLSICHLHRPLKAGCGKKQPLAVNIGKSRTPGQRRCRNSADERFESYASKSIYRRKRVVLTPRVLDRTRREERFEIEADRTENFLDTATPKAVHKYPTVLEFADGK